MPGDDDDRRKLHGHAGEIAYAAIRDRLLRDEWPAGTRLLEADLAAMIGVSRTPVRDALRRLSNEGFLDYVANAGCRVKAFTAKDVEAAFDLRVELESYAARRAASRIGSPAMAALSSLCDQMEEVAADHVGEPRRRDRLTPLNQAFHAIIIEAADNPRLAPLLANLTSAPVVLRTYRSYTADEIARSMGHHRELIQAMQAGDADWAGAVMRSHIHAGYRAALRDTGLFGALAEDTQD
ncbi:GntR family transcriptional regulator [Aurantimonas sp. 22II-16-19i]|uniref:GntR family transcriptional regulator n=1 Tax=Aurantimonas sp. 22II-16-19i TaxID=1317114 RepID=UPI0009F7D3F2|nr:GntR family transcriptional regulator [Aurantimonas sp. 22II-16-19i]ORE98903.1 GntR domain protein [Aurantimonas sp. 22II-16-19i]